jgi:hypothetical protein
MSFSLGPLSNCSGTLETNILAAQSLGTAANHIPVAYIDSIIPAPPFNEDLQTTCSFGFTTTTPIICDSLTATANDITAAAGDIEATLGDITAGGEILSVSGNIQALAGNIQATAGSVSAGTTVTAGTGMTSTTGNIDATAGSVSAGTTVTAGTGMTSTTGNIDATAGSVSAGTTLTAGTGMTSTTGNITATAGSVSAGTTVTAGTGMTSTTGNIEATLGNIDSQVGFIQGQQLKMNNYVDGGTTQLTPQLPPFAITPDMTGKTKGCFWVYRNAAALIQFIVETGIPNCVLNASTFIAINQYNTSNPRYLVNYRIGQLSISPPDYSKLVVSVEFDAPVVNTDPVRVCLMVIPD